VGAGVETTGVGVATASDLELLGVLGALSVLDAATGAETGTGVGAESAVEEGAFFAIVVFVYITR
jgi:hypothetical protein